MASIEPQIEDYATWDMDQVNSIPGDIEMGDFSSLGKLITWECKDPRVSKCNLSRAGAFKDARLVIKVSDPKWEPILLDAVPRLLPDTEKAKILTWMRFGGASLTQVLHTEDGPYLRPWNIQFLRKQGGKYRVKQSVEKTTILASNGKPWQNETELNLGVDWLLLGAEKDPHPWHGLECGWKVLAPYTIGKVNALVHWMRNSLHCSISPLLVNTLGQEVEGTDKFFADLKRIGSATHIEIPMGATVSRLKSEPQDYRSSEGLTYETDKQIGEYLLGQATTTRLDQGSYNAIAVLLDKVSGILIDLELSGLACSLNTSWVPLLKRFFGIPEGVRVELSWIVETLEETQRKAEVLEKCANSVAKVPEFKDIALQIMKEMLG